ncbi:MAG: NAD(P)/FAD-dependent oxidoreductase [Acidimicrobiales bacterium]
MTKTALPKAARTVVIGAGIHGLSTAWHLASGLGAASPGRRDVVVLDKTAPGAGASGIACGVIRNNYFQPAMRELMAHSVSVWESDPKAFCYKPVGYMQIAPEVMGEDVARIHAEQKAIGYPSVLVEGHDDCRRYMSAMFSDWQAKNIAVVLHERRGGYANNLGSVRGLVEKATAAGAEICTGVEVTGFKRSSGAGGGVSAVETTGGDIACDQVVIAVGPWIRYLWQMLGLPGSLKVKGRDGALYERPMWTYWCLQEGTVTEPADFLLTDAGEMPPVMHVDTDAPLYDDRDGSLVTDALWGIYYKPDDYFGGVQGGAMPYVVDLPADEVAVDPYGPRSEHFVVGDDFARMWTSALAHCHKRFEGHGDRFAREASGGLGCFTPDSFPVFDTFSENVYVVADSNHGYKMIGVGALVAKELLGEPQALLEPFRYSRYATGRLHPVSHSPYPWS